MFRKLRNSMNAHEVKTADEMRWAELGNGALLCAAQRAGFPVMITGDKNLSFQQNLQLVKLALVVLSTKNWNLLKHQSQLVLEAVNAAKPGSVYLVSFDAPAGKCDPKSS